MKIAWYVNIVMPAAARKLGLKQTNVGGWLTGAAEALRGSEVELTVFTMTNLVKTVTKVCADEICYVLVPQTLGQDTLTSSLLQEKPDLVHIFGTEYPYNTQLAHSCKANGIPYVVSLQGIMYQYAQHYDDGLPKRYQRVNPLLWIMRSVYYADSIALEKRRFAQQGKREIAALQEADAVIGRTDWDRRCAQEVNPNVRYFSVNENLRASFYTEDCWQYKDCIPHSLFISQSAYPIKGFHMLLQAMPELIRRYTDLQVIVGGQLPYSLNNRLLDMGVDYFFEYQHYIKKLIRQLGLSAHIRYTGPLTAEEMKAHYLRCNVFLSCASIENSPNSVGEAMILGTPIVASDVGGTSTMLTAGEDGILYDYFDTEAMIDGIAALFDDPEKAAQMGRCAREHAIKTHSREKNTQALLEVYRHIQKKADD